MSYIFIIFSLWYFWMITMCCEMSYLYIGLLIQLSYLTYVGLSNSMCNFNETFEFVYKKIAQISWLNSAWLVSQLNGSDLGSEARWLGFWLEVDLGLAWLDHGSMARITTQWLRGSNLEMVLARDLSSVARWLDSISAHQNIYPTNGFPLFFFFWSLNFFFPFNIANRINK